SSEETEGNPEVEEDKAPSSEETEGNPEVEEDKAPSSEETEENKEITKLEKNLELIKGDRQETVESVRDESGKENNKTNVTIQQRAIENNQLINENIRMAALADVTLLDNMDLIASHNDGVLSLKLEGYPLVSLGVGNTYPTFQLPEQFYNLMTNPNFKNAVTLDYDLPGVLGAIRNKGTINGDNLNIDANTGVIFGSVRNLLNLSVGSRVSYNLNIDLNSLTEGGILPGSNQPGRHEYDFTSAVGTGLIDVDLLSNNGNDDTIVLEDDGSESESISESESLSSSESLSTSESLSESESLSASESQSESESLSASESISESESL
ncbi:hypothetical protein, partial [Staphylococcus nepalensis]